MRQHENIRTMEATLRDSQASWENRLRRIRADRRHESVPLEKDDDDCAIQLENDEALDALDQVGRAEIRAIERALRRIEEGTFGDCAECGDPIPFARLEAKPSTETCIDCAQRMASPVPSVGGR